MQLIQRYRLLPVAICMLASACSKSDNAKNALEGSSWQLTTIYTQNTLNNHLGDPRKDDFSADAVVVSFYSADSFKGNVKGTLFAKGSYELKGAYLYTTPETVSGFWLDQCSVVLDGGQTLTLSKRSYAGADSTSYVDIREVFVKVP